MKPSAGREKHTIGSTSCATLQVPKAHKTDNGAEYWRSHGKSQPLELRAVAQAVFGCPASAGVMERDFCIADFFMPRKRGSLDPGFLEMSLFLRAQFDHIPNDVPILSADAARDAIPNRFRDQTQLDDVRVLDVVVEEESIDDDEDVDLSWVLPEKTRDGASTDAGAESVV